MTKRTMLPKTLPLFAVCYGVCLFANAAPLINERDTLLPEERVNSAKGVQAVQEIAALPQQTAVKAIDLATITDQLAGNRQLTERFLNQAIQSGQIGAIRQLLPIYENFAEKDPLLVLFAKAKMAKADQQYPLAIGYFREMLAINPDLNPVRIELAIVLFLEQQDNAAKEQFDKALSDQNVPADIRQLVHQYRQALDKRSGWEMTLSARYLNEDNVNNASSNTHIENTAFVKGDSMLPQKAHGIGYSLGLERSFNLSGSHYLHFGNDLYGKNYWDNHSYDDIINRTYLGYRNKTAKQRWSLLPFYERQWYGNHRYKWSSGVRGEYSRWLSRNWQVSTALEYGKNRYHQNPNLNGNGKLVSLTLVWQRTPRQFFYSGVDFSRETTVQRSFSYDLKTARLGWGQEWGWGMSSRISASISKREYKDNLRLGSVFRFSKPREDKIYSVGITLWKRDWHLWGITPKLNYTWKKQDSNFDSLYSYRDDSVNLFFEKSF